MDALPQELKDKIILYDLKIAVACRNKYIVEKILKQIKASWEDDVLFMSSGIISFIYITIQYEHEELKKIKNKPPIHLTEYLDDAIFKKDIKKLIILDKLFPKSVCSAEAYNYAIDNNFLDVVKWVNTNRPMNCLGLKFKYNICTIKYGKCNCKNCGDGVGYSENLIKYPL